MKLFQPTYFSPISQYAAMHGEKQIAFEFEDNYQKQTYRNRCYIGGPNGKQLLNIPVKHGTSSRKTKDIEIDYDGSRWYDNHIKSLQAAYRSSPYYEFYEADIISIFKKEYKYLIELNIAFHNFIMDALQEETLYTKTSNFNFEEQDYDYRYLANAKQNLNWKFPTYIQMFDSKHGFQNNLSILDLLFMEGPASYKYLLSINKMNP